MAAIDNDDVAVAVGDGDDIGDSGPASSSVVASRSVSVSGTNRLTSAAVTAAADASVSSLPS